MNIAQDILIRFNENIIGDGMANLWGLAALIVFWYPVERILRSEKVWGVLECYYGLIACFCLVFGFWGDDVFSPLLLLCPAMLVVNEVLTLRVRANIDNQRMTFAEEWEFTMQMLQKEQMLKEFMADQNRPHNYKQAYKKA